MFSWLFPSSPGRDTPSHRRKISESETRKGKDLNKSKPKGGTHRPSQWRIGCIKCQEPIDLPYGRKGYCARCSKWLLDLNPVLRESRHPKKWRLAYDSPPLPRNENEEDKTVWYRVASDGKAIRVSKGHHQWGDWKEYPLPKN